MYLIVIAWIYVVLMMSVAEATNSNGTVLGALITFVLYGMGPAALVVYLMGAPARSRAIKKRDAEEFAQRTRTDAGNDVAATGAIADPAAPSLHPDAGGHAARGTEAVAADARIAPMGKEP